MMKSMPYPLRDEDSSLIVSILPENLDSFNAIVLKYQDSLFRAALYILDNEQSALDATQDAFISAYAKIAQFRGESLKAWLIRIVINKSYDIIRACKRHPVMSLEDLTVDWNEQMPKFPLHEEMSPSEHVENHDLQFTIQNCLNRLPFHLRAILVLVDVEGLSYDEASNALNIPMGTVKSRLARARLKMRVLLKSSGVLTQ